VKRSPTAVSRRALAVIRPSLPSREIQKSKVKNQNDKSKRETQDTYTSADMFGFSILILYLPCAVILRCEGIPSLYIVDCESCYNSLSPGGRESERGISPSLYLTVTLSSKWRGNSHQGRGMLCGLVVWILGFGIWSRDYHGQPTEDRNEILRPGKSGLRMAKR
jgi:hypothetical protein